MDIRNDELPSPTLLQTARGDLRVRGNQCTQGQVIQGHRLGHFWTSSPFMDENVSEREKRSFSRLSRLFIEFFSPWRNGEKSKSRREKRNEIRIRDIIPFF